MPFAESANCPAGASSRYFWNASTVPGTGCHFAVGRERCLADQIYSLLVVGIGMFRVEFDGLLECLSGRFVLAGVHQHRAQVVVVLPGLGRIEFGGFLQLRLHFRELLGLAERQGEVVVVAASDGLSSIALL